MMTHRGSVVLDTDRLIMRAFCRTDADNMLTNWVADPEVQSLISEPVYTTKEAVDELLDKYIASYDRPDYYRWAIIEKESGVCIGQIAIFLVDNKNNFCEIEYALGRKFHSRGYGTEAVRALLDFCFNEVHFHKVQVCHKEGNEPSRGVICKCGFTYEGTLRDFFFMDGRYVDRLYYSMLEGEFISRYSRKL